jgi:hypothetical protein
MSTAVPKTAGLVTLRYIIMSTLNRLQDYSLKQYKRYVQLAVECVSEELAPFHSGLGNEVIYLHMSAAKTVNLPADFVDWIKVGTPVNGKLRVLTNHPGILLPRVYDDTGLPVGNTDSNDTEGISNCIFFSDHFRNGQFIGSLFGLPGGIDIAYFRVDYENRQIVFSGTTERSEIVLEYISTGLKADGSSLVPRQLVSPIRNYVLWQSVENDPRVAYNEKERRKREYEESVAALRSLELTPTKDEYLRMIYSTARQSPRR